MPLAAGQTLSHYRVLGPLGAGGMGEVYRALDTRLEREVALKVLPEELAEHPEALARFRREARALAALDHPNIVPIHSVEEEQGTYFLTMGLVEGTTLGDSIPEGGLTPRRFLELALPLVEGVAAAHERGIVHRDLKPGNVMIGAGGGRVRILDFGLARITESPTRASEAEASVERTVEGQLLGTVPYMSPEQVQGRPADERSDVFSLGILLYELASGQRPFGGGSQASVMLAILGETPPPLAEVAPHVPAELASVVERCLEKDPAARFASAQELRDVLRERAASTVSPARVPRPSLWVAGALLLGAAALVLQLTRGAGRGRSVDPFLQPAVAVLPFIDATPDRSGEALAFGLTDEVTVGLMRTKALPVISSSATRGIERRGRPVPELATELGADYLVEATLTALRPRLRMAVTLTPADGGEGDGWQIDREPGVDEALDVADELVGHVLAAVRGSEVERVEHGDHPAADAWEHYVRALVALADWQPGERHEQGLAHVMKALEIDPDMASAWWARGEFEIWRHMSEPWDPETGPDELREIAGYFRRAHEISPFHAAACGCLGYLLVALGEVERARVVFEEAYEANPFSVDLHVDYAVFLVHQGEYERARAMAERALRLDPISPDRSVAYMVRSIVALAEGDRDAARADLERSLLVEQLLHMAPAGVPLLYVLDGPESAAELLAELRQRYPMFSPDNPTIGVIFEPVDRVFRAAPDEFPESVAAIFRELDG